MAHARQTIREAFATAVTGLTTTGTRVYQTRRFPLADDNLPGLCVYTDTEEIVEPEENIDQVQVRFLTVLVKGYDKLRTGLDDKLDTIAAEVETAIFAASFDDTYGLDLLSTEIETLDGAEQEVGEITISFRVQYLTNRGAPTIAL